jgi:hypothetical protein
MPLRILVTGSRSWTDEAAIDEALRWALSLSTIGPPVLVHGDCPYGGADLLADRRWRRWMRDLPLAEPELHPMTDYASPRERNQAMVAAGATVCLAFATRWASGTGQTARMARRAGIWTRDYGANTE